MPAAQSDPDVTATPVPYPTAPVARRSVDGESERFDWTDIPGVDRYRLQIAEDAAFEEVYYDEVVERPATVTLSDVLPEEVEEACWRVRADVPQQESPWSAPARFETGRSATRNGSDFLVDAPPVLLYPAGGDAVHGRAAGFAWEAVPEASGYRLQVSDDDSFDDPDLDLTVDEITSLSLFGMLPDDANALVWRVRALFPDETEGPWSEPMVFGTDEDLASETEMGAEASRSDAGAGSPESTPRAAGPAATGHTSRAMAIAFITVLVVSFLATIAVLMTLV